MTRTPLQRVGNVVSGTTFSRLMVQSISICNDIIIIYDYSRSVLHYRDFNNDNITMMISTKNTEINVVKMIMIIEVPIE